MVRTGRAYAHMFRDENRKKVKYWRDIGTLDSYFEASMELIQVDPLFNLYDTNFPIVQIILQSCGNFFRRNFVENYPDICNINLSGKFMNFFSYFQ
jgi:ADP-glucose pyrophosphorylase